MRLFRAVVTPHRNIKWFVYVCNMDDDAARVLCVYSLCHARAYNSTLVQKIGANCLRKIALLTRPKRACFYYYYCLKTSTRGAYIIWKHANLLPLFGEFAFLMSRSILVTSEEHWIPCVGLKRFSSSLYTSENGNLQCCVCVRVCAHAVVMFMTAISGTETQNLRICSRQRGIRARDAREKLCSAC